MSDTYINIRFGAYHLQLTKQWKIRWIFNKYHTKLFRDENFKWFKVYEFPGLKFNPD